MAKSVPASNRITTSADNIAPDHWLEETFSPFSATLHDHEMIVASELPASIHDDATSGHWQDIFKDIVAEGKKIEALRVEAKEPFLAAGRKVDGKAKTLTDRITKLNLQIGGVIKRYLDQKAADARREAEQRAAALRAEEDRKRHEQEEAQRKADKARRDADARRHQDTADAAKDAADLAAQEAFEVEANAQAKPADFARTRSEAGTLGTLAQSWDFRIDDIGAVKGAKLWPLISRAEKERAIRQYIRQNAPAQLKEGEEWQPIEGVTMFRSSKLQVR